ncbi:MAG: Ig-like domain-containing protein, partial [Candidatus Thorarchaeota archaeon]
HGDWVIGSNGFFDYEPFNDWHGTDSFTYRVFDGTAYSGIVTVTITVEPVNDAPVAKDDAYTTGEDVVLVVDAAIGVIANDDDIDGDALSAQIVSGASHGNLVFNADGSFTYTPDGNWFGEDFFTYEVTDGTFTDTATVTIKVLSVNDAPVAVNDTCSTLEDVTLIIEPPGVLANDFDIDGDPLTTVLLDMPLHGIVSLEPDGAFTYIPDQDYYGFDIFTYQVFDGTEYSDKAFVIIEVIYVNTPPTAYNDVYTTEEGVSLIVEAPGVLANDVDVDEEDILEAMLVDAPMHGMLVLLPDGWFNYTPDAAWCGVDTFTYYAFDGLEYSNIATVTITVVDVTPPVTTIQFVGDAGEYHWYYSDVEVTMTATDDCSGVASTLYSVNGSEWMPYIDSFVLTNPGEYIIRYYSMDNAGNIEDTHTAAAKISKYTRGYVTGAGWILEADGSKDFFSILVKYRRCGSLYGHINYMFKDNKHLHALKVKGSQILGLIIEGNHAIIEAKGVVYRTGCRCHYYHYSEVFYLRIEVWDNGKGKSDVFQIRIFDEAGDLFHEAGFDPPGTLLRGSILIGPRHWYCWCRDWW